MKPKVIKSRKEHEAALARIEKLMDARPGTPAGDELDLLATLDRHYPALMAVCFGNELPSDALQAVRGGQGTATN